jgi:hypothetical protein
MRRVSSEATRQVRQEDTLIDIQEASGIPHPVAIPTEAPVLEAESVIPFFTSASITVNAITLLANTVKTFSQQSLELAARYRTLVQVLLLGC